MRRRISSRLILKWPVFLFFSFFISLSTAFSHASAVLRVQQIKAQKQHNQAVLEAQHKSVSSDNVPFGNDADSGAAAPKQGASQAGSVDVKETVDLTEVWKKLDQKSTVWTLLIDDQAKNLTAAQYIDRFHKEGVKINEPPAHYVQMIDQIIAQNPPMLQRPFGELLQIAAIVDYDFDNGMNKDDLAKKVLGEAGFEANKKRFVSRVGP